jgi:formylglycine-generating enzyme required for sulfatase activity
MKKYVTGVLIWSLMIGLAGCPTPNDDSPEPDPKSSDAALKILTVSVGELSPAFDPETTEYTVEVPSTVDSLTLTAAANHAKARAEGGGEKALSPGANPFAVTVTAEDETTKKTYAVTVTRDDGAPRNVTINSAISNGTVTAGAASGSAGTLVYLTITADSGYHLNPLSLKYRNNTTGVETAINPNSQSFALPASDVTVLAEFITMEEFIRLFIPVRGTTVTITPVDGDEAGYPFAEDKLPVTIADFDISATEITVDLYNEVVSWAAHTDRGLDKYNLSAGSHVTSTSTSLPADPFQPVVVGWTTGIIWCNAYSEYAKAELGEGYEDFEPLYVFDGTVLRSALLVDYQPLGLTSGWPELPAPDPAKKGFRLATDAEWEFAARGGVPSADPEAPWNWVFAGHPDNYTTVAVSGAKAWAGTRLPNTLGIYDMCGNAVDFVWDPGTAANERICRGGSYASSVVPKISSRISNTTGGLVQFNFRMVRQK